MEGVGDSSNSNKKKKDFSIGFINHLFSWTLADVFNDDFFKHKVGKIPESFESVDQYVGSFIFPLLEETRAELSSSLKAIHVAPFVQVVSVEESKSCSNNNLLSSVKVDSWRNTKRKSGKEPYRTFPGDVFLLIDGKPDTVNNLQCPTRTWAFAWVSHITENGCPTHLKLHVSKDIRGEVGLQKTFFIVFLMNVTCNLRIWNSLHFSGNVKIIKQVLNNKSMGDEICNKCSLFSNAVYAERLGMGLSLVLNDSQKVAVLCSVCKTLCDHKPSVELIWGPPGTGKTKTVSFLLLAILEMNQRILACAPTNVAITELASRVVMLLKESSRSRSMICSLGNILLFGNKDRLKVGSELEEIYLDYRIDRLVECFGLTGWKYHITSMIKLLEGGSSEYHTFLECNLNMRKVNMNKNKSDSEVTSFLGFIREKFKSTALALRGCLQTLTTHIPKQFILEHNFQNIEILLNLIDSFGMLLFQDDVIPQQIEILFSCPEAVLDFPNSSVRSNFLYLRFQCLSVLRNLQASLDQLQLPSTANKKSMKKFCFQKASLILCTASCSFKLNSVKMDPVNVLVIDEAAQLKECESIVPLQLPSIKHAILAGDVYQLPAIVTSKVCDGARYGRSLFERLSLLGHSKHLLNTQYRMHPSISCFPNFKFYSNQILDAPLVMNKLNEKRYLPNPIFGPYSFINVSVGKEDGDDDGHSKKNNVEVAVVIKIIEKLHKAWSSSSTKTKLSIGVISFYAAQVSAIQEKLGHRYQKNDNFTVKVKSVDGFQGGEEDVIILSTVRSNRRKTIGFISNLQRINVALTRAKQCLWIVGDATTLGCSNSEWDAVVSNAKDRRCFFSAEEDRDLADAIIEVKKVDLELDDLLNKDSMLFKMAQWKVLLSDSFRASFVKVESIHQKKSIVFILLRLSSGWRPETDNISILECSDIIKHVKVEGLFIIYTMDIEKVSKYTQVLRIWDIKPLAAVKVSVECLSNIYEMYTDDYLNHCKSKSLKGDLEIPITWSSSHDIVLFKDHTKAELDGILSLKADSDDAKNLSLKKNLVQMKFQSLSYQKAKHLLSGRCSKELDLPCQVEDDQLEIVLFPDSSFIMGRPGAEKTAALTMKLFKREQQQQIHPGECSHVDPENTEVGCRNEGGENYQQINRSVLRQLFITATFKQCLAVKEQFSYLKRISYGGNIMEENQNFNEVDMLDMDDGQNLLDIPNSFDGLPFNLYPLVITYRKFLMMLDGTVGDSYFVRFHKQWNLSCGRPRDPPSTVAHSLIGSRETTCKKFASSYWPYFDGRLTKKLDAVVVFNEITSQIKGGLGANEAYDGKLSRENYTVLSKGQKSRLSRKQRDRIYDIFLEYERMKTEKGDYDLADLIIDLHNRLKGFQYAGDQMDFVYVDEVQSLTMRQIALLKYMCGNVKSGFVFSSNTAQTIAKGVDFRFQDIRFLFYKEFISKVKSDEKDIGAGSMKLSDILYMNQIRHTQPKILQLANSVMDLLFHFFPQCIDTICPETSEMNSVNPETPALLENGKGENVMKILFEERNHIAADTYGFGAEQVILVRDEFARKEISNFVGNRAIILTIMECQCLEFQDVLLYNFFSSSPLELHWRVIYQYMNEQDFLESVLNSPNLNQEMHMDLCWELKHLYVAITRSRRRLWIYEEKQGFSNPIFDYWKKLCYIQVKTLDFLTIQAMQVPSTKEKWSSLGLELFSEGVYEAASLCFQRAEDPHRKEWARAASLCATAGIFHGSNPQSTCRALQEAAEIYLSINHAEAAALCLIELKGYKEAAHIYLTKCGETKLEDAGDCYMLAECYQLAAEVYSRGSCFLKFLNVCTIANLFDMGLQMIQSWRKYDDVGLTEKSQDIKETWRLFLEKGALHYHQLQDFSSMMKFVETFNSVDAKCTFLGALGLSDKILLLEENSKKATTIMMKKVDVLLEIDLLEKDEKFKDASLLILRHVLFSSLWVSGKKGWPLKLFKRKERLVTRAKKLAMNDISFYGYVCTESDILSNQTSTLFEMEQNWSACHRHGNLRGIILSAWRILDAHLSIRASKYTWDDTMVADSREHVEQTFSKNQVSVQILVYFWNFWKEKISGILKYLQLSETEVTGNYASYEEFCLDYLGVRKQLSSGNIVYLLLDPEAEWAKRVNFLDDENHFSINAQEFAAAAQSYWFSEVFVVGLKVISKLKDLYMFSIRSSLSLYSYSQAFTAILIFEIAKFLTDNNDIKSFIDFSTLRIIFDLGHQSILYLRLLQTPNPLFNEIQAVNDNSQSYLLNCAHHFHEIKDKSTMLKFVGAFCSMDSKRTFLKSFNYFNELLALEMGAQNFSEALTIATLQGYTILEIDLLEKTGNYKEACLLLIVYICANSLWTSESKGWPLKKFRHKQKLLAKVKSIARHDSVSEMFYDMISTEANILSCEVSGLIEMKLSLTASESHKNLRGVILSAWKILDAHLQLDESAYVWEKVILGDLKGDSIEAFSQNQVSFETLVCFWNFWKDRLINIFDYLSSVETQDVSGDYASEQDFCLSYLGARRQSSDQETLYYLLNSDADWAREVVNGSVVKKGGLIGIAACQFASAALKYWSLEVFSVGIKVLEKLKALYIFSTSHSSELCQSMMAISFCEVENFLMNFKFLKHVSETMLQNFTNARLQFILCCKQHMGQDSLVINIYKLDDVKFYFLRKCALHYHRLQDNRTMMKFVQAFHSIDSKRLFFKSLGCFDELLLLEEESGNFMEAVAIARLKGDPLLEVDLLQKAGQLKEAVELVLFYVLASSLWTTQSKGWPLKQFQQKEKLLSKAKSIAELHSDVFRQIVYLETSILSDKICSLSEMKHHLSSSRENNSIFGEILSARKILDAHLCSNALSYSWEDEIVTDPLTHVENKISQNQVSIETLSHFWNLWKDNIMGIIKYLEFLGTKNVDEFIKYEGFCLKYLAVRKQSNNKNTYQLLISEADWIMHISAESSLHRNGKLITMDVNQFTLAARRYWNVELLSVGLKVLVQLSDIHRFSVINSLSKFHQSLAAIRIFEIANFLKSSNIAKLPADDKLLQDYLESYAYHFFDNVFGVRCTYSMTKNMIGLRETELCRSVIEAVIFKTIDSENELTYEKIGKVVMALLGSGKLTSRLYDMIARRWHVKLHWKAVIDAFKRRSMASEVPESSLDGKVVGVPEEVEVFLINQLHEALRLTFVNWKKEFDFISPDCFLYVVERQFILISMFQGCFYTTRSSFIEWLVCEEWQGKPGRSMVDVKISSEGFFDFIAKMVNELLFNNSGARKWIKRFNIDSKEYYPIFLLRLVIIMCLLCANLDKYFDVLYDFLGKPDVRSQLPGAFTDLFKKRRQQGHHFLNFMAEAVWKIKNPLIKVCCRDMCQKPVASRGMTIRMKHIFRKEDVWKLLFVKNPLDDNNSGLFSGSGSNNAKPIDASSPLVTMQAMHRANENDNRDGVVIMTKQNSNEMSKSMKSKKDAHIDIVNLKSRKSSASQIKVEQKFKYVQKETTALSDGKLEKGKLKVSGDLSDPKEPLCRVQGELKLEYIPKQMTPQNLMKDEDSLPKLQFKPKLESAEKEMMAQTDVKTKKDTVQIVNYVPRTKESSQKLQFEQKLTYVRKESTASSDWKLENDKAKNSSHLSLSDTKEPLCKVECQLKLESIPKQMTPQNHVKAEDSPPKLQFKPKLEPAEKEMMAQTNVKTEKDTVQIVNYVPRTKESSQKLQFEQKLIYVRKEATTLSDGKWEKDKAKLSSNLSDTKEPLCKGQCELKLESLPKQSTPQKDVAGEDFSPKLNFKPKLEFARKETMVQTEVKTANNMTRRTTEATRMLQIKQKIKYVPKETTALSVGKLEKDKAEVSNNLSDANEPSCKGQCELKLESIPKQMTPQKDVKTEKDKQNGLDHKSIAKEQSQKLKFKNTAFIWHPKEKEIGKEKPHSEKGKMKVDT